MKNDKVSPKVLFTDARLRVPPSKKLIEYSQAPGLEREMRHFYPFLKVDMAHTVMLVERKILARSEGARILEVLNEIEELGPERFPVDPGKGSFLLQVEDYLFGKIGEEVGGKMHTGRSRIDQGATVRRLYKRDRLLDVIERLIGLQMTIIEVAGMHVETIMPGYTHMQHAQPWVLGHYLLSFFEKLEEDFQRLQGAYRRVNLNPLGTVGLSGTSWPLDRERTTELLGFGGLVENSKLGREAYYAAEAIGALSFVMADLNDLATDFHIWSSFEFGLLETADEYCSTSSIFPQKKNPSALETIKKAAGGSVTWLATALGTFRAEGTGDQAMRELPLIDHALTLTERMIDLMIGILDTLIVHRARMGEIVAKNWSTASNLADEIVKMKGLSYRQAHHVVGRVVRIALEEKKDPMEVTGDMIDRASIETVGRILGLRTEEVRNALDPEVFIRTRVTKGSVNPKEIKRMLKGSHIKLGKEQKWLSDHKKKIKAAYDNLEQIVRKMIR